MNIDDFTKKKKSEETSSSLTILKEANLKEEQSTILNQHSALATFKLEKGKYYKVPVEKAIFALKRETQKQLKAVYREAYINIINRITNQPLEDFLENLYNKNFSIDVDKINKKELEKVAFEITQTIAEDIKERSFIESEQRELFDNTMKEKSITKFLPGNNLLELKDKEKLNLTQVEAQKIIQDIKEHCKLIALRKNMNFKTINLTILANSIGANSTELKKGIKEAVKTYLSFNYIDRKNLKIEVITNILASVRITQKAKSTELTYQIPREILELLILPEVYAPLDELHVDKIQGIYTYRMYSLLSDHLKRGEIEVTKEEIFTFFDLPKSYEIKTNFTKKFLTPALDEVKEISGIETKYEFIPNYSWKTIKFYPKKVKVISNATTPAVVEEEQDIYDNPNVLKYIEKSKRNIYIQKAWKKTVDNRLNKILNTNGEEVTIKVLKAMYELKSPIETTLVQYIAGILKNFKEDTKKTKTKSNSTKEKKSEKKEKKEKKKQTSDNANLNLFNLEDKIISLETKDELKIEFENLDNEQKLEVEKEAVNLCAEAEGISPEFLFTMKRNSPSIYFNTIRKYIEKTMKK
ncbi:replication initiation protein [uncultured Fusobacterium sp.]|uniref:replication initiation protein n=1 Tax=uncultured Fusobacterium sp. TaxID=159267 RepID=UPI0025F8981C|nr:replication initiation protein [uncultured Fusobacterium sp.]